MASSNKPLVIFGLGPIAELADYYFRKDVGREVAAFTVDGDYVKEGRFAEKLARPLNGPTRPQIAQRARIVDLLLEIGRRELVVDRQPVAARGVDAGGVPKRRIEKYQRARRATQADRAGALFGAGPGGHLM